MTIESMILSPWFMPVFLLVIIWSSIWKYIALWKCGRNKQLTWYVVMAIVNTVGILEIIYLAFFQKDLNKKKK